LGQNRGFEGVGDKRFFSRAGDPLFYTISKMVFYFQNPRFRPPKIKGTVVTN
jgi:hypothetical protein